MHFSHEKHYGRDCFYPIDINAKRFVDAFPHSSGKRKSLTISQIVLLNDIGAECEIEKSSNFIEKKTGDINDAANH